MLLGIIIGVSISYSSTIYAEVTALVGKKIQKETPLVINGVQKGTAVVVDGKSYASVRTIGEAAGYKVGFNQGGISLESSVVESPSNKFEFKTVDEYDQNIRALKEGIEPLTNRLSIYQDSLAQMKADPEKYNDGSIEATESLLTDTSDRISTMNIRLAALEKEREAFIAQGGK